jgi:phosphoribosylamine--glycine ligase
MESDLLPVLVACVEGKLSDVGEIRWKQGVSVCVVIASKGYPEKPERGKVIRVSTGLSEDRTSWSSTPATEEVRFGIPDLRWPGPGVTALGSTYEDAIKRAYEAVNLIDLRDVLPQGYR